MKNKIFILFIAFSNVCYAQNSFEAYLEANRQDLNQNTSIQIGNAKIIGFGALHGSAKTEETEVILLKEFVNNHQLKYYLPETDYSTANYFQKYIETGDEKLLEELVYEYGAMVAQEKSIEVFEKWKALRPLFLEKHVRVIGVDKITSYKFAVKELLSITEENTEWNFRDSLKVRLGDANAVWYKWQNKELNTFMQRFVEDYEQHEASFQISVRDTFTFNHILKNIKYAYETYAREGFIYSNYLIMSEKYGFDSSLHYARFGLGHIVKSTINGNPTFFSMLIENGTYASDEVLTIQGFLTKSSVLWDTSVNEGNITYTTKKGFGISDYWLEHFYKIRNLKKEKLSDITLFKLNTKDSPYSKTDKPRLIKVKKLNGKSGWTPLAGKSTLDYIDFAVLISNSEANRPIENLK